MKYAVIPRLWLALALLSTAGKAEVNKREAGPNYLKATITTEVGELDIELFSNDVPSLVSNFVELANKGFYKGAYIYGLIDGLALQMGSKKKNGKGGPGYTIDDQWSKKHDFSQAGMLAYSSAGPDMNGSNFLINLEPTPHFQNRYPIFGRVIQGPSVLQSMVEKFKKAQNPKILKVTVHDQNYKPAAFKKRTPFSTDEIESISIAKAKSILTRMFKEEKLGQLVDIQLKYQSLRGRQVQVAYEANSSSDYRAKIILLGRLVDDKFELQQFQYQQLKAPSKPLKK